MILMLYFIVIITCTGTCIYDLLVRNVNAFKIIHEVLFYLGQKGVFVSLKRSILGPDSNML